MWYNIYDMKKNTGFTLVEMLVVIAIIGILAAILFPVFSKAREQARIVKCSSNQQQIIIALNMYTQENDNILPDKDSWITELSDKVTLKVFHCPNSNRDQGKSYGISSHLFYADGQGINIEQIITPSKVGVLVDVNAPQDAKSEDLLVPTNIAPHTRHYSNKGYVIGYFDGHIETANDKSDTDSEKYNSKIARAFYYPPAHGHIVGNYSGYLTGDMIGDATVGSEIYGTPENEIILSSIADWSRSKGSHVNINSSYFGYDFTGPKVKTTYIQTDNTIYAQDAIIFIANNAIDEDNITSADLLSLYGDGSATNSGSSSNYTIYALSEKSIISATVKDSAIQDWVGNGDGVWDPFTGNHIVIVGSPRELINRVASDAYAVGYAPAHMVDPNEVKVLNFNGIEYFYKNPDWPLVYNLGVIGNTSGLAQYLTYQQFVNSPIFSSLLMLP